MIATKKNERRRRRKPENAIAKKFTPMFWENADSRLAIVREIRSRYQDLKADAGVDSIQKDILAQRVTFMTVYLETLERKAIETGEFEAGKWSTMVNTLIGLLRLLGLKKHAKDVGDLRSYVKTKVKSA